MWRSFFIGFSVLSAISCSPLARAQDSGPGPISGSVNRAYDVLVVRIQSAERGIFTFAANPDDGTTNAGTNTGIGIGGSTTDPAIAGDTNTTTPTTTPTTSTSTNTTTSGAARTGTTTTVKSFYQSSGLSSRINRSSGSYGFNTATGTVATSADTGTNTNNNVSSTVGTLFNPQIFTSGVFTAELDTQTQVGTWYAIDLGNFSIWYANAADTDGAMTASGFATPETISGRLMSTSGTSTSGSFYPMLFDSAWFFGTSAGDGVDESTGTTAGDGVGTGTSDSGTAGDTATMETGAN
jgi:hypothetical protein